MELSFQNLSAAWSDEQNKKIRWIQYSAISSSRQRLTIVDQSVNKKNF